MSILTYLKNLLSHKPRIIVILGQTSTGKTNIAIKIAQQYNGEVVSADSRQVYRGLDLGSGKVTQEEMQNIPHHMLNVADPKDRYTVVEYEKQAAKYIEKIITNKKIPIICGGSGQYIDAILNQRSFPQVPPNPSLRNRLEKMTLDELFQELEQKDPKRAHNIDRYNKVRLVRALEVVNVLGIVPKIKKRLKYKVLYIGLKLEQKLLHERILERIHLRLKQGMLDEAVSLYNNGLSYERMEELGLEYRFMAQHLQGKISHEEMIFQLNIATRKFAKRQKTWFKRNKKIDWFNPIIDENSILMLVKEFLK